MPRLTAEHRRALTVLGGRTSGCTDDVLELLGFSQGHIDELILAGLASAETKRVNGNPKVSDLRRIQAQVRQIRLTETGWQELEILKEVKHENER